MKKGQECWSAVPLPCDVPEGFAAVASAPNFRSAGDFGLAILAMGHPYWTFKTEGGFVLCVRESIAVPVVLELKAYADALSLPRASDARPFESAPVSWTAFLVFTIFWFAIFVAQFSQGGWFTQLGSADSDAILRGSEWWRIVTALTLHGDLGHWIANGVSGAGFAMLVCRFFGAGWGWVLLLVSGALGNALNAWVHFPEPHVSIGASTAVFGGLGILTGGSMNLALRPDPVGLFVPKWVMPVLAGLTLLGLLGTGGIRTDVSAHICGFLVGVALGFVAAVFRKSLLDTRRIGAWAGGSTLLVVALAWALALA